MRRWQVRRTLRISLSGRATWAGDNLGFMDGHARWQSALSIFADAPLWPGTAGYTVRWFIGSSTGLSRGVATSAGADPANGIAAGWDAAHGHLGLPPQRQRRLCALVLRGGRFFESWPRAAERPSGRSAVRFEPQPA